MTGGGWPAPAKVNLFLHVTGRRADGLHELQTLFQFLDLCDTVRIEVTDDGRIERSGGWDAVPPEQDLAIRAAHALRRRTGGPLGARLGVDKRIPVGGGLGGGSSDAATVLVVLDHLWGTGLGLAELAVLGLELGADVPVFIHGHAAWAQGVGEQLTPATLPERWYVVLTPPVSISTAAIYADPALRRDRPPQSPADIDADRAGNDLEPVVRRQHPEVGRALDWLGRFGSARLSGSGASTFLAAAGEGEARAIHDQVPERWRSDVTRGLNRSPLALAVDAAGTR